MYKCNTKIKRMIPTMFDAKQILNISDSIAGYVYFSSNKQHINITYAQPCPCVNEEIQGFT